MNEEIKISDEARECARRENAVYAASEALLPSIEAGYHIQLLLNKRDGALRKILKGHPDSRLDGEYGLTAATMRRLEQLEDCCRIALWIRGKLEEKGKWGADLEEWDDIRKAIDKAAVTGLDSRDAEIRELRADVKFLLQMAFHSFGCPYPTNDCTCGLSLVVKRNIAMSNETKGEQK